MLVVAQAFHNRNNAGRFPPAFSCMVQTANQNCCLPANEPINQNVATYNIAEKYRSFIKYTYRADYPDNENIYSQLCITKHIGSNNSNNPSLQMAVFFTAMKLKTDDFEKDIIFV